MADEDDFADFTLDGVKQLITANNDALDEWNAVRGIRTERMDMKDAIVRLEVENRDLRAKLETVRAETQHICGCPEFGTYAGQVVLVAPEWLRAKWPDGIGIDVCLALEIQSLWRSGIQTSGHCCGHGRAQPYIGVFPEFIGAMKAIGYQVQHNPSRPGDEDSFWPKTKLSAPALLAKEGSDAV